MRCCSHCIWRLSGPLFPWQRDRDEAKTKFTRPDLSLPFEIIRWLTYPADLPGSLNFFHAGTSLLGDGSLVTSGGRVMAVLATADSLEEAVKLAYTGASMVHFEGMFYRRDIAYRLVL